MRALFIHISLHVRSHRNRPKGRRGGYCAFEEGSSVERLDHVDEPVNIGVEEVFDVNVLYLLKRIYLSRNDM